MNIKKMMTLVVTVVFLCSLSLTTFASAGNAQSKAEFKDLKDHWSQNTVEKLISKGVVGGYQDKTFRPENSVTRAEFSKMLNKALKLKTIDNNFFPDIKDHWARENINTLVNEGVIIKAEYGESYNPDKEITRLEIAKMLVRSLGYEENLDYKNKTLDFTDSDLIAEKDKNLILIAKETELVGGYEDKTFRPNNKATRAESCVMIMRALELKDNPKEVEKEIEEPKEKPVEIDKGYRLDAEAAPKKSFRKAGLTNKAKQDMSREPVGADPGHTPRDIIPVKKADFPIKFEDVIFKNFKFVPHEKTHLVGNGTNNGLLVIDAEFLIEKNADHYFVFIADETGNVISRRVNLIYDDKTRKDYPNIPKQDPSTFSTLIEGPCSMVYPVPDETFKKGKYILLVNRVKEIADVIRIPIN